MPNRTDKAFCNLTVGFSSRSRRRTAIVFALLLCCLAGGQPGCRQSSEQQATTRQDRSFHKNIFRPYDSLRAIVDSIRVDFDGDGLQEFVVTSKDVVEAANPVFPREFDRLEIFALDTVSEHYESVFIDPVESGQELLFRDVTGDGRDEMVVRTNSGGNDPVVSEGMNIYGLRADGSHAVLFYSQGGIPEMRDLNGDKIPEVIVTGEYWGIMSHADVIAYTSAIYAFDGNAFIEANAVFGKYFDRSIAAKRVEYLRMKSSRIKNPADHAMALYRAFADWLVWIAAKGDVMQVKLLWEAEKTVLQSKLSPEQWEDLESLALDSSEVVNPVQSQRGPQSL